MAIFNLSKFSLKKDPAKKEANKYLKSIKKDPQREQKLDSIQNVYNKQFDDFDMGSEVQGGEQDFDKNYNILKKAGRDTIFGMVKNPPFNITTKNTISTFFILDLRVCLLRGGQSIGARNSFATSTATACPIISTFRRTVESPFNEEITPSTPIKGPPVILTACPRMSCRQVPSVWSTRSALRTCASSWSSCRWSGTSMTRSTWFVFSSATRPSWSKAAKAGSSFRRPLL